MNLHSKLSIGLSIGLLIVAAGLLRTASAAESGSCPAPTAEDYSAAARLWGPNLFGLVRNETVEPHWIGTSGRFWYRRDGANGPEVVLVGPDGSKAPAFDHAGVGQALAQLLGTSSAGVLPATLTDARVNDELTRLSGRVANKLIDCDIVALKCGFVDDAPLDASWLLSPDGRSAVFARNDNLWLREIATGKERALTTDGAAYFSWGKLPDVSLTKIARDKSGAKAAPFATQWSPDSRYVITARVDERKVGVMPYVEWVPTDGSRRPIVHEVRTEVVGDADVAQIEYHVIDMQTGRVTPVGLPEQYAPSVLISDFERMVVGWSARYNQVFLLVHSFDWRMLGLFRFDLASGRLTKVIEETSATRVPTTNAMWYAQDNMRLLKDGAEILWFSDRSGWGQLYLYDAQNGRLKRTITRGDWLVYNVESVDERSNEVYFTAVGREPGRDAYYRHLYKTRMDGRASVQLLTTENADHSFEPPGGPMSARLFGVPPKSPRVMPAAGVFLDTWSTVDQPPRTVLRSTLDGRLITELERADASKLYAAGWKPPVRKRVKAADGVTDVYAVYYAADRASCSSRLPVIDSVYGGPQIAFAPYNFTMAYMSMGQSSLTKLGFHVVTSDGRGTPMRSRAFNDAGYPEFTQVGIDDHVAVIRALAKAYSGMDLDRVGISGASWGGTFTSRAMLTQPELFKVGVSAVGLYDYTANYRAYEPYLGAPVYANGTTHRSRPDEAPANWAKVDMLSLVDRLRGDLLIIYGDLDENVPPVNTMRLIDALTRANQPYDLMVLPNRTHFTVEYDPYVAKRTWDYFVEHLLGTRPQRDFRLQFGAPVVPGT
ncbi:S9 family peptidase [Steroidobacter sp.]|uniref:S9 family peptidase n=1 Tax=Steroidobacter sp. TaxID=1978227 RepID=UPI001A5A95A8|nr:DPP IV N-terminal domain-containing protein [Steroidobacter sp.]MBL8271393.1 DPP IV N-terminal domain-containing protein [Steroidobacter sp.]